MTEPKHDDAGPVTGKHDKPSIRDLHITIQVAIVALGRLYAEAAEKHKEVWKAYSRVTFPWASRRSIARLIRLYHAFGNYESAVSNIDFDALFTLSADGREQARLKALEAAKAGRFVTDEDARNLVALNRQKPTA